MQSDTIHWDPLCLLKSLATSAESIMSPLNTSCMIYVLIKTQMHIKQERKPFPASVQYKLQMPE